MYHVVNLTRMNIVISIEFLLSRTSIVHLTFTQQIAHVSYVLRQNFQ